MIRKINSLDKLIKNVLLAGWSFWVSLPDSWIIYSLDPVRSYKNFDRLKVFKDGVVISAKSVSDICNLFLTLEVCADALKLAKIKMLS